MFRTEDCNGRFPCIIKLIGGFGSFRQQLKTFFLSLCSVELEDLKKETL